MFQFDPKSELEIQEKIVDIVEKLQTVSKKFLAGLAVVLILAIPSYLVLRTTFFSLFYSPTNLIVYKPPQPEELVVVDKGIIRLDSDSYSGYARVLNPNNSLAIRNLSYQFILRASSGELLQTHSGVTYILPGQEKLLFLPLSRLTFPPQTVEVKLTPERWSKVPDLPALQFGFERVEFGQDLTGAFFVAAILRNDNPYLITEVELSILLYNLKRQVVGVNFTKINTLLPNERRFFRVVSPHVPPQVVDVEFRPAVNQLKVGVLLTEEAPPDELDPRRQQE